MLPLVIPGRKNALSWLVMTCLAAACASMYLFAGPFRFKEYPISESRLSDTKPESSPVEVAYDYLYGKCSESDRPKREALKIKVRYSGEDWVVVRMNNDQLSNDSLFETCDRLTLQRRNGTWAPIRHQAAWQGRGQIGWTTRPCS